MPMMPMSGNYPAAQGDNQFSLAFSEQAYGLLGAQYPELLPRIATFKVVESDLNKGRAIGAFILMLGNEVLYVPVVLNDGDIKPMSMVYRRSTDSFMPLGKEWLARIESDQSKDIGNSVTAPPTLNHDASLRNLIRPPNLIGRFAYASDESYALKALSESDTRVKKAFANTLKNDHNILQCAIDTYGLDALKDCLQAMDKVAAEMPTIAESDVVVFKGDPRRIDRTKFKSEFGPRSSLAYQSLVRKGYAVSDKRTKDPSNALARLDVGGNFRTVNEAGVYEIVVADGAVRVCFALPDMRVSRGSTPPVGRYTAPTTEGRTHLKSPGVLVVFGDTSCVHAHRPLGREMQPGALEGSALYKALYGDKVTKPGPGAEGVFIHQKENGSWVVSPKLKVTRATSNGDVDTYVCETMDADPQGITLVRDLSVPVATIKANKQTDDVYLPPAAKFLPLKTSRYTGDSLISSPDALDRVLRSRVQSLGANKLKLVSTSGNNFSLDGQLSVDYPDTLKKVMVGYDVDKEAAERALDIAQSEGQAEFFAYDPSLKTADMSQDPYAQQGQDPYAQQGQDPYAQQQQEQPQVPVSQEGDLTIDPSLMQEVSQLSLQDPQMFDVAVMTALSRVPEMRQLVASYIPNLEKSLDNMGRIILAIWIHNDIVREQLGDSAYMGLEDALVAAFKSVGEAILKLSDGTEMDEDPVE